MGKKKPNLVLVFADQMRYMDMGCTENEQIQTPNLNKMASEGVIFDNAVSNCAVCGPARAMMMTGLYTHSNTVFTNNIRLPDDIPGMGDMLKKEGYSTGYIGKWHLAGEPAEQGYVPPGPMRHGFDYWAVHNCSHKYYNSIYYTDSPEPIVMEGWQPDKQTDLAIEYIKGHTRKNEGGDSPFALVLSWGPPHTPFIAPREYVDLYPTDKIRLRPNVDRYDWLNVIDSQIPSAYREWWVRNNYRHFGKDALQPELILREFTSNYYAAITNLDYNMGRIMESLAEAGIDKETLLVFTSDHGEMLGSHGQLHKWQPWEESIRVPFIAKLPGVIPEGFRTTIPFGTPDILPTLFGLMGLDVPGHVEGKDLSFFVKSPEEPEEKIPLSTFIYCMCAATTWGRRWGSSGRGMPDGFFRPYRGVRTQTHTYVRDKQGPWFLYDNEKDPYQLNNLIEKEGGSYVPSELENELKYWLERTGDYFGKNEDYQKLVDINTGVVTDRESLHL
jgi:arylsulfatase A-like enzyme